MNPELLPVDGVTQSDGVTQTLSIRLFGPPQIFLDDQPIHFASRKAVALIAYLALHEEPRPRAEIATILWSESDRKRALGALRYTLAIIRKELGDSWLQADRKQLGLRPTAQLWIDVRAFNQCFGRDLDPARLDETSVADLERAVALYREEFLATFALAGSNEFEEWHFFQREALQIKLSTLLAHLTHYYAKNLSFDQAIVHAKRWLQIDPLQEQVHRELMTLYAAAGQADAALRQYQSCVDILAADLDLAPAAETTALLEQIRQQRDGSQRITAYKTDAYNRDVPNRAALCPNNLQAPTTPFLGREEELLQLADLLSDDACRLISLIGPGGIGKTRLAEMVAIHALADEQLPFTDSILFVPLASVESATGIVTAVADALGFTFASRGDPLELLSAYLAGKQILFVLDNFEQLVPEANLLVDLLRVSGGIKMVVTSRERLNLYEEWVFAVEGLPVELITGGEAEEMESNQRESSALQLFRQRARRANPKFELESERAEAVSICQLVKGMPLGIELAAGWVGEYECVDIEREIAKNLDFLATSLRNVPDRHRSLRAVFLHSWGLLDPALQAVFCNISVFQGGFTAQAAEAVAFASSTAIQRLVDKSLLVGQRLPDPQKRPAEEAQEQYNIHEMLRQYASEKLATGADPMADEDAVRWRHCLYFAGYVYQRQHHIRQAAERQAAHEVDTEIENVRAAWQWAFRALRSGQRTTDAVLVIAQIAPMLSCLFTRFSRLQAGKAFFCEAVRALEALLQRNEMSEPDSKRIHLVLAQLRTRLAEQLLPLADFTEARACLTKAIVIFRAQQAKNDLADALAFLSRALISLNQYEEAEGCGRESLALYEELQDRSGSTQALYGIGVLYLIQGQYEEGIDVYHKALAIYRQGGYRRGIGRVLSNLGTAYARMASGVPAEGNLNRSLAYYRESLEISIEENEPEMICVSHSNLGSTNRQLGNLTAARTHFSESLSLSQAYSMKRWTAVNLYGLGMTLFDAGELSAAAQYLKEGLESALRVQTVPDVLDNLAGLACILAQNSRDDERRIDAAMVLHFVLAHERSKEIAKRDAKRALSMLGEADLLMEAAGLAQVWTIPEAVGLVGDVG